ncbi:SDR family oxidoreductase [Aspergillus mulundensis]|uniref:NAD-dependent epimerase/dehydratase domain-containing protein n=1 Tax=Aspergillus mulundensis TaxID=1810919 RepID=A0A3D8RSC9_9EURO|nr:Uncharacterized protein DSM5745_06848 [Aspergillus mulundensis]RDW76856.1 Uncharacterized protein DSM5745_06848 [Aspergillus mulundensis]
MSDDEPPLVLVTGGTSFIAKWIIATLLRQNYRVRTTIRTLTRIPEIHASLSEAGTSQDQLPSLQIVHADLTADDGWTAAMKDVTYVQHVASPFPSAPPAHEDELIIPAVQGTKRVLCAARDAGVRRVVMTSSVAAILYGAGNKEKKVFSEEDWTDLDGGRGDVAAYPKSKTLAERAAWEFMEGLKEKDGGKGGMELVSVNPVCVYGPALGKEDSTTLHSITELTSGNALGIPRVQYGVVDVRDCADLHVLAMTHERAGGERFICVGEGMMWMGEMATLLRTKLGEKGRKVPSLTLPDFLVRAVALVMPVARLILPDLGRDRDVRGDKAREMLGWRWKYSNGEAVMAAAESLIKFDF